MPGIDGYQVARRLKANASTANIPIIMLSGQGEQSAIHIKQYSINVAPR